MKVRENILLKDYTTFKIGGPAKYFVSAKNEKEIGEAVKWAKNNNLPFFILGGGSNLLVADGGYNGLVIKILNTKYKILNTEISVGAGIGLAKLLSVAADAGLSGLEWSSGIPGATLGGAIRGNAGAFETGIRDIVKKVEVFDAKDLRFKIYDLSDCQFGYRESIFKKNHNLIIFSAELEFKKGDKNKIKEKIKEILSHRMSKHPKFPSAGSIFKNFENVRARDLIEKARLKGKRIGRAQISDQHANFIVNLGGASCKDVLGLMDLAKKEVKEKFNLELEEEIHYLSTENR